MTSGSYQPYPEKRLQAAVIEWMLRSWKYTEMYSDAEATGSPMDSVGILDGRLLLIEVKLRINARIVDHDSERPQSLEGKIVGALRSLYGQVDDGFSATIRPWWDRRQPPVVIFLAKTYSGDGLNAP
jgi:hypothetical protein